MATGTYGYEDTHKTELAVVRNRQAVSKYLQAQLDAVELPCEIRTNYGGDKDYSMWGIEQDSSLKEGPDGIEIVSPVLFEGWQESLTKLFGIIDHAFAIIPHSSAGTHIHVAPVGRAWTIEEIQQLSKGIIAWSAPLRKLMQRQRDKYAAWNQWNAELDALSLNDIVEVVSPDRYRAWNFRPLLDARGTIEFRRPYQTLSRDGAQHWVAFTLGLFAAFLQNGNLQLPLDDAKDVRKAIGKEANKLGLGRLLNHRFFE